MRQATQLCNYQVASKCYRLYHPRPAAKQRILVLPHAGGSASYYRGWAQAFPSSVEVVIVQYPGREDRMGEPLVDDMSELVTQLAVGLRPLLTKPYLLFGHSMGGAVAYELFRQLACLRQPLPEHLVISAIEGPSRHHGGNLHQWEDQALLAELDRLEGSSLNLQALPELAEMVIPLMRSDYRLIECYSPEKTRQAVNVPLTVMAGSSDNELQPGDIESWKLETKRSFQLITFPGGHFYLKPEQAGVIEALSKICKKMKAALPAAWAVTP